MLQFIKNCHDKLPQFPELRTLISPALGIERLPWAFIKKEYNSKKKINS